MQMLDALIIKPSFFDDDLEELHDYKIWKKPNKLIKSSEVRVLEGILFKKSSKTNLLRSGYYILFEDRLAYYRDSSDNKEQAYCVVQNMRLVKLSGWADKGEGYGIRLIHNLEYCDLFTKSKAEYDSWISALSAYCVLSSYATDFINLKVIGKGSFAKVYLANRKKDDADLAVKIFNKGLLLKQEKAKASLINEINIMRCMNHDNIIKLYEVYESDNHIYLVQELLNGGELFDRIIKKGQYSEKDASTLMKKLLNALAIMHSKGIMHRDIKPENLLLKDIENDWNVKIADFGLATFISSDHDYLFTRCGTPGYVAPEVLVDARYDQKVDVFSAGIILYIILTGASPFYGKSYNEILWKNKECNISFDFKEKGLKVSHSATDLLKKMLAKDPAQRITADEALQHEWIVYGGSQVSPSSSPHYLCSAQENMKKFQEENRFNVKNIKPKDLDRATLEKCVHAPSPLFNGKIVDMAPSREHSLVNSPEFKLPSSASIKYKASPSFVGLSIAQVENSPDSTGDESDDPDGIFDERIEIDENISKYKNGFNLISHIKKNNGSPVPFNQKANLSGPIEAQGTAKKVLHVQENLLGYVKP